MDRARLIFETLDKNLLTITPDEVARLAAMVLTAANINANPTMLINAFAEELDQEDHDSVVAFFGPSWENDDDGGESDDEDDEEEEEEDDEPEEDTVEYSIP